MARPEDSELLRSARAN